MSEGLNFVCTEETVTFSDDYTPEISGYGTPVKIKIESLNKNNPKHSIVIRIGDYLFLPSQIENILKNHNKFKKVLDQFYKN